MTRKGGLVVASLLALGALAAGIGNAAGGGESARNQARPTDGRSCITPEDGRGCLPVAPASERVDLARPSFSNPTQVTNPLHPTSRVNSVLMLGRVDRLPFRTEVTLLPETKTIAWNGQQVETRASQYVAFLDGRVHEVALDWYAQADDGSVWYFGEDVFNYEDGVVADPHVGDVYRPENIPGLVFEEVTVRAVRQTMHGPRGRVDGAILVEELHMDGTF